MKFNLVIKVERTAHGTPDKLEILGAELSRINRNINYALANYTVQEIMIEMTGEL